MPAQAAPWGAATARGRDAPLGAAAVGAVAWLALAAAAGLGWAGAGWIDLLLCFGLLCVVPLGFGLVRRLGVYLPSGPLLPAAAWAGAASVVTAPGLPAGLLAAPWVVACALTALWGLSSLAAERSRRPRTLLLVAALGYLAFGSVWLLLSAVGARPLGFPGVIVELTAVHFLFAGFAAPLVAAVTAAALQGHRPRAATVARTGGFGVVAAMPMVAAGFVLSPLLSAAGAAVLAVALGALAVVQTPLAVAAKGVRGVLLGLASLSVLGAMALAVGYAVLGSPSIARMAALHGTANAFGFCGGALLAYTLPSRLRLGRERA